jgi:hypothetical protein
MKNLALDEFQHLSIDQWRNGYVKTNMNATLPELPLASGIAGMSKLFFHGGGLATANQTSYIVKHSSHSRSGLNGQRKANCTDGRD